MHHRPVAVGDLDRRHLLHDAVGADHGVLEVGEGPVVRRWRGASPVAGIDLRVGGVAVGEGAAEVGVADGVELVGELDGAGAGLDDGEGLAAEADHVGVGGLHAAVALAGRRLLAERSLTLVRAHHAGVVPVGPAAAEADAVDHGVADEPVVGGGVDRRDRVGAVAEVAALELGGQRALDDQLGGGDVALDRGVGTGSHLFSTTVMESSWCWITLLCITLSCNVVKDSDEPSPTRPPRARPARGGGRPAARHRGPRRR